MCAVDTHNAEGEYVAFNQTTVFIQRAGGFGGHRTSDKSIMPADAPQRPPDVSVCVKTSVDQVHSCGLIDSCSHGILLSQLTWQTVQLLFICYATATHYLLLKYIQTGFTFPVLSFWCRLTQVVPDRIQEGRKMVVCVCARRQHVQHITDTMELRNIN